MGNHMIYLAASRKNLRACTEALRSIFQNAPKTLPKRSGSVSGAFWERFEFVRFGSACRSWEHQRSCRVESTCMRHRSFFESIVKLHFGWHSGGFWLYTEFLISCFLCPKAIWKAANFGNFFHDGFAIPAPSFHDIRVVSHLKFAESSRVLFFCCFFVSKWCPQKRSQNAPKTLPERFGSVLGAIREWLVLLIPVIAKDLTMPNNSSRRCTKVVLFLKPSQSCLF